DSVTEGTTEQANPGGPAGTDGTDTKPDDPQ
ncbi:MAG: hypothetical protein ACI9CA_000897, partial [Natronomonas sp.]